MKKINPELCTQCYKYKKDKGNLCLKCYYGTDDINEFLFTKNIKVFQNETNQHIMIHGYKIEVMEFCTDFGIEFWKDVNDENEKNAKGELKNPTLHIDRKNMPIQLEVVK